MKKPEIIKLDANFRPGTMPIVYLPDAIPESQRASHKKLREALIAEIRQIEELPNGYRLNLSNNAALLLKLAAFIALEQQACPFLTFTLDVPAGESCLWLSLTGREGTKAFLQETMKLG
ncbi:MAG: hypothetical protein D6737_08745 [Chloroflexi bacterium]|nr:MAG: hypothetical protein D6737_08745 [Chloroflexota bacterium]